jgi:adenosine kinase
MNQYLLSGSFAYDTILLHEGQFHHKILPESIARLNVAFSIDSTKNEYGGTGGNIAYNAALLRQDPLLIGSLGYDGKKYITHMEFAGLDTATLTINDEEETAHAYILTDSTNNQITGFHAGSMKYMPNMPHETPHIWHLAPENPANTARLAKRAIAEQKQYFFDPGQALPYFIEGVSESIVSLKQIIANARGIFVNEYEAELLSEYLKAPLESIVKPTSFVIRTLGSKGCELITHHEKLHIPVAKTNKIVDPTGCGDAFRAGFLFAYTQNQDLKDCMELGSVMGSFAIEESGGQNHKPSLDTIMERKEISYGKSKKLKM